jgi:hypothetical protein
MVHSLVACSLEVHLFEACLCWRRAHSRRVYVGDAFIGGALSGGDVVGCAIIDGTIVGYCTVVHGQYRECGGCGDFCQAEGGFINRQRVMFLIKLVRNYAMVEYALSSKGII